MQLSLMVQLSFPGSKHHIESIYIGYLFSRTLYTISIDCEGSFMPDRLESMVLGLYQSETDKFLNSSLLFTVLELPFLSVFEISYRIFMYSVRIHIQHC